MKKYGVQFSGHGSSFIPEKPKLDKTLSEAIEEADHWERIADTIGGRANIVDENGTSWIAEKLRK